MTILKWISLTELIGIVILNSLWITLQFFRKRNSRMSFFVRNLAISDLSVGLIYLLLELIIYYYKVGFISKASCYLYLSVRNIPIYASTFALVVLTLDRLYVVTRPIESATSGTKYKIVSTAVSWTLAVIFSIPYYVVSKFQNGHCYYNYNPTLTKVFFIYGCLVNMAFPLTIMGICYTVIVLTICRKQRSTVMKSVRSDIDNQRSVQESFLSERTNFFAKAKIRSIKLLLVVILAYAICWTPVTIGESLLIWKVIGWGPVFRILYALAPLNSFVNPLVFLLFNTDLLHCKPIFKHNTLSMTRSTSNRMNTSASNKLGQRKSNSFDKQK